jgi:hypothetical protein
VKLRTRKLAAFVTCLGLAAAFPVLSSADKGGIPNANSHKPCPHKGKRKHKHPKPNNHGKKCGFEPGSSGTTTSAPTTSTESTETETETESTTTTTGV